LGENGPEVGVQGLGCMGMSFAYGPADEKESRLQELCSYRTISPEMPADIGVYLRFSTYDGPVL
ncbi:hypothetical protein ACWC9X_36740, partial [Streptomyces asoensis]